MAKLLDRKSVDVLLAAFNSEAYLSQQIESILNQSYEDFKLIILDDYSTDGTQSLIEHYQSLDARIERIKPSSPFRNPIRSFEYLLGVSTAEVVFLSDHDDFWLPDKILEQLNLMEGMDDGNMSPLLVASNTYVASDCFDDIKVLKRDYPSFHSASMIRWFNDLFPEQKTAYFSHSNLVVGHTIAVNRTLVELSLPFPDEARMHDWWLAILANVSGKIFIDPRPMTIYRQHLQNYVGSSKLKHRLSIKALKRSGLPFKSLDQSLKQCSGAMKRASRVSSIREFDSKLLSFLVSMPRLSCFSLYKGFLKFGLFSPRSDLPKLLGQILFIALHRPCR